MPETITSLIEKLEGAEVGSRELDCRIWGAVEGGVYQVETYTEYTAQGPREAFVCELGTAWIDEIKPVTTSLDAGLALAERVLPGARVMVERFHDGKGWAMAQRAPESAKIMTDGNTPALALCAAILRAKQ